MITYIERRNNVSKEEIKPIIVPSYTEEKKSKKSLLGKVPFLQKKKTSKKKTVKKEQVLRKTPMIMPFIDITEDYIVQKNCVMDILKITPKDEHSLTDLDLQRLVLEKVRFYRSYFTAHKVVGLNFPSNTERQRRYWITRKEKTTDPLRLRFINRKIFELEFVERERANREFFLFIYAESPQILEDEKKQVIRGLRQSFPLEKLSIEKRQDILFIMANQNSKL